MYWGQDYETKHLPPKNPRMGKTIRRAFSKCSEKTQKIIDTEQKEEYEIKLIKTTPEVTINDIGLDAFPNLLAEFSTKYDSKNKNRTTNLKLASDKINGTVIMPN